MSYQLINKIDNIKNSYDLFLFDFDGVILESVEARDHAFKQLFNDYSVDICEQVETLHKSNPGIDREVKIKRCYEEIIGHVPSSEELQERVTRFGDLALENVLRCEPVKGVIEFLNQLDSKKCFVVSAARQNEVRYIVEQKGLSEYFSGVYGGPESKSDLIKNILEHNSVTSLKALFIGDKKSDWTAAQKTGVVFFGRVNNDFNNPFSQDVNVFCSF